MKITFTPKFLGRSIVIVWASFAVVWQIALLFSYSFEGENLVRFMIMVVKPLFLGALTLQGHGWPRAAIGITGTISAFLLFLVGLGQADSDQMGPMICMVGAVIYGILSITVLAAPAVDRLRD